MNSLRVLVLILALPATCMGSGKTQRRLVSSNIAGIGAPPVKHLESAPVEQPHHAHKTHHISKEEHKAAITAAHAIDKGDSAQQAAAITAQKMKKDGDNVDTQAEAAAAAAGSEVIQKHGTAAEAAAAAAEASTAAGGSEKVTLKAAYAAATAAVIERGGSPEEAEKAAAAAVEAAGGSVKQAEEASLSAANAARLALGVKPKPHHKIRKATKTDVNKQADSAAISAEDHVMEQGGTAATAGAMAAAAAKKAGGSATEIAEAAGAAAGSFAITKHASAAQAGAVAAAATASAGGTPEEIYKSASAAAASAIIMKGGSAVDAGAAAGAAVDAAGGPLEEAVKAAKKAAESVVLQNGGSMAEADASAVAAMKAAVGKSPGAERVTSIVRIDAELAGESAREITSPIKKDLVDALSTAVDAPKSEVSIADITEWDSKIVVRMNIKLAGPKFFVDQAIKATISKIGAKDFVFDVAAEISKLNPEADRSKLLKSLKFSKPHLLHIRTQGEEVMASDVSTIALLAVALSFFGALCYCALKQRKYTSYEHVGFDKKNRSIQYAPDDYKY